MVGLRVGEELAHAGEAVLRDLLRAPEFPQREVARLKDERLAELLQLRAEPGALADEQFARAVYAPTARYAAPAGGSAPSVRALTRDLVQAFYSERGFTNEPKRCKNCRDKRKTARDGNGGSRERSMVSVTCDSCGVATEVPFTPVSGKPVYCRDCYNQRRSSSRPSSYA